jgi:hypothetical protein
VPRGERRPNRGDRVDSSRVPDRFGRIVDWQGATPAKPERWLVQPEKTGEVARWLTVDEFTLAPEPRPWL